MQPDTPKYQAWRRRMAKQLAERGITDKKVLKVVEKLPRHWFISETLLDTFIYDIDHAVEIDCGQTISKPLREKTAAAARMEETRSIYRRAILCWKESTWSCGGISPCLLNYLIILLRKEQVRSAKDGTITSACGW